MALLPWWKAVPPALRGFQRAEEACEDLGAVAFSRSARFPASAPPPCVWLPSCAHTHSHHDLSAALCPHLLVLP